MVQNTEERELQKKSKGGLVIIIGLAVIFFTLLMLLIFKSPDQAPPVVATPSELYVVPLKLRIRTQPSARSPVVDQAARGERLEVLEISGPWVRVKAPGGLVGWAERSALETPVERDRRLARIKTIRSLAALDGVVLNETVMYSGPGLFYPVLGQLDAKTKVRVFTRDHDFYAIDAEGGVAYVQIDDVDLASPGVEFDVAASEAPEGTTDTAPESAEAEPPPFAPEVPIVPITPAPAPDRIGVYEAVPAGGREPVVVDRVMPEYPGRARRAGVEGTAVLRGIVRRDGRIDDLEVVRDPGLGLGEAARRAVRRWRFRPASYQGETIDVYYTVTVNFKLAG